HPEEAGLDPAHARVGEVAAEGALRDGMARNRRPIGLVHDDRVRVIVRKDVPARGWPARRLIAVGLSREAHAPSLQNRGSARQPRRVLLNSARRRAEPLFYPVSTLSAGSPSTPASRLSPGG